jgi:hypothetical protein
MHSTVDFPIAFSGGSMLTSGSFAVLCAKDSADIAGPGAIAPPRYLPLESISQNIVADPKSLLFSGPP